MFCHVSRECVRFALYDTLGQGPRLGGVNLRKIVALSQIRLATRFPAPSVHAVLPDLDGRTHAPSVGAAVKKFRASAMALA